MRLAFIVLCVLNAAFAAYVLLLRGADDPAARIARLQVSPETIRVVPQPGSGRADASADAAVACLTPWIHAEPEPGNFLRKAEVTP